MREVLPTKTPHLKALLDPSTKKSAMQYTPKKSTWQAKLKVLARKLKYIYSPKILD